MFRKLASTSAIKLNPIRYYCSISNNLATMSHKFILKSFEDIQIGDVISSPDNFKFYRIFEKSIKEHKYQVKNMIADESIRFSESSIIVGEEVTNIQMIIPINYKIRGSLKSVSRINTETFTDGAYGFGSVHLVLDTQNTDKLFHKKDLNVGDIILNKRNNNYYKLLQYKKEYSEEYGGTRYDCSYFDVCQVDPKNNFELFGEILLYRNRISYHSMTTYSNTPFVVLDNQYLTELVKYFDKSIV
jgi:hypothetical protein